MKFDILYPNADIHKFEGKEGVIKGKSSRPCGECKDLTQWVDINFECPICSTECQDKMIEEYNKTLNKAVEGLF